MKNEAKKVKHVFTPDELAELNRNFHLFTKQVRSVESEFDSVKANYKAKVAEAQAKADTISTTIDAGFEMRDHKCVVIFRVKDREKDYYLETDTEAGQLKPEVKPVLTEGMTEEDLQMELVDAESKFELKDDIQLFTETDTDSGVLVVGKQGDRWFGAIRCEIGKNKLEERLDGEQKSCKKRADTVGESVKRFQKWLTVTLGKENAQGFDAFLSKVIDTHKLREE